MTAASRPSSRRRFLAAGVATAVGSASALALARRYDLVPPDAAGLLGPGETLNYATQRGLQRLTGARAREFRRDQISTPFPNGDPPDLQAFNKSAAHGFQDWRIAIDGLVRRPLSLSLDDLKSMPRSSQITQLACEEGWSFIAEWSGVTLAHVLKEAGVSTQAKYVVYFSTDEGWWDSIDIDEALHPQTLLTDGMNGAPLPRGHGAPIRLRVPRQLGYKSVKRLAKLTVTGDIRKFGKGLGSGGPEYGYAWFAGV